MNNGHVDPIRIRLKAVIDRGGMDADIVVVVFSGKGMNPIRSQWDAGGRVCGGLTQHFFKGDHAAFNGGIVAGSRFFCWRDPGSC